MAVLAEAKRRPTLDYPRRAGRSVPRLFGDVDGVTLEDSILRAWEDLVSRGRAECPVCGGEVARDRACRGCGSELS